MHSAILFLRSTFGTARPRELDILKCFLMQMDREKRTLGNASAHLMILDEVPKFVLEPGSGAKSGTVSDEEGLDDIMDPRQRRRMLRNTVVQSEVRHPWSAVLLRSSGLCMHRTTNILLVLVCLLFFSWASQRGIQQHWLLLTVAKIW